MRRTLRQKLTRAIVQRESSLFYHILVQKNKISNNDAASTSASASQLWLSLTRLPVPKDMDECSERHGYKRRQRNRHTANIQPKMPIQQNKWTNVHRQSMGKIQIY